jgi:hypothetical protein
MDSDLFEERKMATKSEKSFFYLSVKLKGTDESVFFKINGELMAKLLCGLFTREYSNDPGEPAFTFKAATTMSVEDRVLTQESLDGLDIYHDLDPGLYDPPPSKETLLLVQYAQRANTWEQLLTEQIAQFQTKPSPNPDNSESQKAEEMPNPAQLPPGEWENFGLILLMLLSQTYYRMLECTVGNWFATLDLELNQSYLWTVQSITNLLKNHEGLKDFPIKFEPVFPDLYPSTLLDVDWQDMVAPDAERFLSTVQQYVNSKSTHEPEEGSPTWILIEMFQSTMDTAIQRAVAYNERMSRQRERVFGSGDSTIEQPKSQTTTVKKRFKIALSFPGERRQFVEQVAKCLAEKIGRDQLFYDKYYEPELARIDLDSYLQKIYHDDADLIAVFLCSDYEQKEWCGLEWRAIRDLIKRRSGSAVMPLRFDKTEIPGLFSIDGYVGIGTRTPSDIASCILERMHINAKSSGIPK